MLQQQTTRSTFGTLHEVVADANRARLASTMLIGNSGLTASLERIYGEDAAVVSQIHR
jgi:uncharacterized glyoxalase superfamily metalloenzyme YdcJ